MLWGGFNGSLELRTEGGATRLRGRFPYGAATVLATTPTRKREVFAARAFAARIEAGEDIHLLAGHSYDRPLASRSAGNLRLTDGDDALTVEAEIEEGTTWARDFLAANAAGLIRGLSPGFRVPRGGERIEQRGGGVLHPPVPLGIARQGRDLRAGGQPVRAGGQSLARGRAVRGQVQGRAGFVRGLDGPDRKSVV